MEVSTAVPKRTVRGEALVIAVLSAVAVVALLIVFALVNRFRDWQTALADRTYRHGLNEMDYGSASQAIEYFRSALFFQPDNFDYQFSLAQGLENAGRFDEAEAYLQNLWEKQPQSGSVNLQLGRLAAHRHQTADVLRYYHNAIYGIWKSDPDQNRRIARLELVDFLIANNDVTQAQAELIAMQAGLPSDPRLHTQLANLFMSISDYEHAFAEFREARQLDRQNIQPLAGAGIAAFKLGRFRTALHFLDAAVRAGDRDPEIRNLLETAELVISSNTRARGISLAERIARVQKDFTTAKGRLQQCMRAHGEATAESATGDSRSSSLAQLATRAAQLAPTVRRPAVLNDPNEREDIMEFVFDVEEETEDACGTPTGADLALLLLGRSQESAEQ